VASRALAGAQPGMKLALGTPVSMRPSNLWRALQSLIASIRRAPRGPVARLAAPEFTALDTDFFQRGAELERGVIYQAGAWDIQSISLRVRR
jgi:hypothetical protein